MMKKLVILIMLSMAFVLPTSFAEATSDNGQKSTASNQGEAFRDHCFLNSFQPSREWSKWASKYTASYHKKNWTQKWEQKVTVAEKNPVEIPVKAEGHEQTDQNNQINEANPSTEAEKPVGENTEKAILSNFEQQVLSLTNVERQKAGLQPLKMDESLTKSAQEKSKDMARQRYFSHLSPTYGSPFDMMKSFGITYKSAAENIARGQRSPEEVVQAWMNSPGHRQNILTANFTHIGIGYEMEGNYWTQQFIQK